MDDKIDYTFNVNLSSKFPTTITCENVQGIEPSITYSGDVLTVPLAPLENVDVEVVVHLLAISDDYAFALWNSDPLLTWERGTDSTGGTPAVITYHSYFTINYYHLPNRWSPNPYWTATKVGVSHPNTINMVSLFTTVLAGSSSLGDVENPVVWNTGIPSFAEQTLNTITPSVRPGEYITLRWEISVDGSDKSINIMELPFETPLFTGGKLLSKTGDGPDTRYSAEIFGNIYTNIIPTDFFDYTIGKWAYFAKKDAPTEGEHQAYSDSDIEIESDSFSTGIPPINNKYVLTPFDFGGYPSGAFVGMAVPNADAISLNLDSAFEEVFDMVAYHGLITAVDTTTDTADVLINDISYNLPVFYHCTGGTGVTGGAAAFSVGDTCTIENPKNATDFSDACIIGFPDKLKPCEPIVIMLQYKTLTEHLLLAFDIVSSKVYGLTDPDDPPNLIPQPFNFTDYNVVDVCAYNGIDINDSNWAGFNSCAIKDGEVKYITTTGLPANYTLTPVVTNTTASYYNRIVSQTDTLSCTVPVYCEDHVSDPYPYLNWYSTVTWEKDFEYAKEVNGDTPTTTKTTFPADSFLQLPEIVSNKLNMYEGDFELEEWGAVNSGEITVEPVWEDTCYGYYWQQYMDINVVDDEAPWTDEPFTCADYSTMQKPSNLDSHKWKRSWKDSTKIQTKVYYPNLAQDGGSRIIIKCEVVNQCVLHTESDNTEGTYIVDNYSFKFAPKIGNVIDKSFPATHQIVAPVYSYQSYLTTYSIFDSYMLSAYMYRSTPLLIDLTASFSVIGKTHYFLQDSMKGIISSYPNTPSVDTILNTNTPNIAYYFHVGYGKQDITTGEYNMNLSFSSNYSSILTAFGKTEAEVETDLIAAWEQTADVEMRTNAGFHMYPSPLVTYYQVVFYIGGGTLVSGTLVQTVKKGENATAPTITPPTHYTFGGWWPTTWNPIMSDVTISAQYVAVKYTVTFTLGGGTLLSGTLIQQVSYLTGAIAPVLKPPKNKVFSGWDKAFNSIIGPITVNPIFV